MPRILLALMAPLLLGAAAATQHDVMSASDEFDAAQLHGDRATLERYLAGDMIFVRGSGKVTGRDEFIATFTSPGLKLEPFEVLDRRFIALGKDAGIVAGEAILRGTEDGKAFVEHIRYADTFTRREGRWQVVYVQVTPLPT
ncbi:MAG TPA: nuclear transport factor 2 family protein [Steroidobacteraceae bacterium]|nr:nuclear transport factor 2 family protein [Steroidobacteraceae bacterium]